MQVKKRDGSLMPFDRGRIQNAVMRALRAEGIPSEDVAANVTGDVVDSLKLRDTDTAAVEEIQDLVEVALMKRGLGQVAKSYILYRAEHARARRSLRIRSGNRKKQSNLADQATLVVQSMTSSEVSPWDRAKVVDSLTRSLNLSKGKARDVAKEVENRLIDTGMGVVNSAFVRELVNSVLLNKGYTEQLRDLKMLSVPREFVDSLMYAKVDENSNIASNNPEAVSLSVVDMVMRQYAREAVFSPEVRLANQRAEILIHDMSFPHRLYCSSHSIEYIKKYGLKGLCNLNTVSKPAKTASVLTGHLNTFLASIQAYYAGALGLGYVNILYAPLLRGMPEKEMYQVAQEMIFNGSQNAFSRGGQVLFIDYNVHTGVPVYLRNVPAVGPGGMYMFRFNDGSETFLEEAREGQLWKLYLNLPEGDRVAVLTEEDGVQSFTDQPYGKVLTYGDFRSEAIAFAHQLLNVWSDGDANGHVFEFPKCDFHVSKETFTDPDETEVFRHACRVAASNGSPYFIFDRDAVSLSSCCRLKVTVTDKTMITHPEHLRTCGYQNVSINIPQAAYRAASKGVKTLDGTLEEIGRAMDTAVQAHLEKKAFTEKLMRKGGPLWQIGKTACDGRPYVDLKDAMYIIGIVGVNDAVHYLTGKEMHESRESADMALRITGFMYLRVKEYTKRYGLTFKLEESPAESAAHRLAKADLVYFHDDAVQVVKGGDEDHAYYTNSIHLAADAPVDLVDRIETQALFNPVIEAGAITHAFIGEEQPDPAVVEEIIRKAYLRTQSAQITFSPEFTYCEDCGKNMRGLHDKCAHCGSSNVFGETRIVGYFSRVQNWQLSKLAELAARRKGSYRTAPAQEVRDNG